MANKKLMPSRSGNRSYTLKFGKRGFASQIESEFYIFNGTNSSFLMDGKGNVYRYINVTSSHDNHFVGEGYAFLTAYPREGSQRITPAILKPRRKQ